MQAKILFPYTEMVVPPRCRKPRPQEFTDGELSFDIPEVTEADAPVAIRCRGKTLGRKKRSYALVYRWWNQALWSSVRIYGAQPASMTAGQDDWDYPNWPAVLDLNAPDGSNRAYEFGIYTPAGRTRRDWEHVLREVPTQHLIVDGVAYRRAGEPRYVVMTFGLGQNHGGTACMMDSHYNQNIGREAYFNLLQRDAAVAYATQVATNRGDTKDLPIKPHGPKFEVLIPEAIQVNSATQHGDGSEFLNAIETVAQETGGSPVAGIAAIGALLANLC